VAGSLLRLETCICTHSIEVRRLNFLFIQFWNAFSQGSENRLFAGSCVQGYQYYSRTTSLIQKQHGFLDKFEDSIIGEHPKKKKTSRFAIG
jgi:hypothetical protein